jgi:DNA-binding transcriptional regulator YiaG
LEVNLVVTKFAHQILVMTGKELKELRIKAGLTQLELAIKLGTYHTIVSDWENEKHKISRLYEKLITEVLSGNIE